jgi:hypothetical protein
LWLQEADDHLVAGEDADRRERQREDEEAA